MVGTRRPKWVEKEVLRYEIVESSSPGNRGGRPGKRLQLYLQHPVQGNMNPFVVSDSRNGLFHACSRDHLDGVMVKWDEALLYLDDNLMKSQLEPAKRYPEVYVLICVDLFSTQFAQTPVGQQYKTSQQRADLLCPFSEEPISLRPEDDHSRKIIRFTVWLNDSVKSRAVSSINAAPISTSVQGPLSEIVRARTPSTAPPAVATVAEFTAELNEVKLTEVMTNWMQFETRDELLQYDELYDHVSSYTNAKFGHDYDEFCEETEESIQRYKTWRALSNAFVSLKGKFGMTEASTFRDFPWMFNETLRANLYDEGIHPLPPGVNIPSGGLTTDPFAEPIFVTSDARGVRTLERMVHKPTVQYGKAKHWHVPGNTALDMHGMEAKGKFKPTKLSDGSWIVDADTWITSNFHVRYADVESDSALYKAQADTRAQQPTSSDVTASDVTDVCTMGPPGEQRPIYQAEEKPLTPALYFIAHNRFGYLPHLNTLYLQVTRAGLPNLQRKSLANRSAFDEMIKRLGISEHPQFLRRLSEIEQWPRQNFTSPPPEPPKPPSTLPLESVLHSREQITSAFQILSQVPLVLESDPDAPVPESVQHALHRNSSLVDIKRARDRLYLQFYPDKCHHTAYTPQFQAVKDAFNICSHVITALKNGEIWRDGNHRDAPPPPLAIGAPPSALGAASCPSLPSSETPCRVCGHVHKTKGQELRSEKRCFNSHGLGPEWNPQHPSLNPAVPCQCHVCVERASKRQRTV